MNYAQFNKLYIGGAWKEGRSQTEYAVTNPYNKQELTKIKLANVQDIDDAYQGATDAQQAWADVPAAQKVEIMEKAIRIIEQRKEEFVQILVEESGSSFGKASVEVGLAINMLREAATFPYRMTGTIYPSTIPGKENRIYRKPAGVVTVISPWNFPFVLSMRSVAPALAAGNSVVLKPDSQTAICGGTMIGQIFEEAGLPPGVLSVVVADVAEIGDALLEHPVPQVISFTGSTAVGKHVGEVAGRHLKKASLELGGNNAFVVLDDADLESATSAAVFGKYLHQGQICMSVNRFIVDRTVYDDFLSLFKEKVSKIKTGDPAEHDTVVGPLINVKQAERVKEFIQACKNEGAKIILDGKIEGNLVEPYIIADVDNQMTIAQNEIFGPVAAVIPVDGEQEAIDVANGTNSGLSGAVFTSSTERGVKVAKRIQSGMVHVNDQSVNDEPFVAFGGEKDSGLGRHNGQWALEEFTTVQWISVQEEPRTYPFS